MLRGRWLNKRANEKSFEVHFWSVALTFAIINSTIDNSKGGGVVMSSIDLVILGIVLEKPQSAYDIQKDVEYHHLSRWTKISVPSIYRKVLQLSDKGYLQSDIVKRWSWFRLCAGAYSPRLNRTRAMRGNLQTFLCLGERFLSRSSFSIEPFWNGWITLKGSS